ncbi:hypothetical protein HPG69_018328 [Diceros bicornis minor]|uniref:Uncharacterized protein n=1 Tax=Diceros bicornis minor TaxID=77932 RepID=A0A7J7FG62_DICBM|nr:hypothetical protein HPG69_018328 [Diceros bicornis minor]
MGLQLPNFSCVLRGQQAGLALPGLPAYHQFLLDPGVRHLMSLTERGSHTATAAPASPCTDCTPQTSVRHSEQINHFVLTLEEANAHGEVSGHYQQREEGVSWDTEGRTDLGRSGPGII